MTDGALSESAMLTSLRDIHLPAEAAGGLAADLAVTVGVAGCAALLIAAAFRMVSLKQRHTGSETAQDRRARLAALPEAERRVALLHLLRAQDPQRYAAIRGALYQPGGGIDIATLEAEVTPLV